MSLCAVINAFDAKVQGSSTKFVLVALANYAGDDLRCWPTMTALEKMTSQDHKTIRGALKRLLAAGLISDTGERRGMGKKTVVWQLQLGTDTNQSVHQ